MADPETAPSRPAILFGGSCACGRITYECRSMPENSQLCHCVTCQKLSGASYQGYPEVPSKSLTFYDQKETLRYEGLPKDNIGGITFLRFSKVGERAFCRECYSPLAMRYKHDPETISVTLGTIDEATIRDSRVKEALKPTVHIFASQAPWWDESIGKDGLRVVDRFSEAFQRDLSEWEKRN